MKIIEKLTDMIDEELSDAKKYAKCALKYAEEFPELSQTFLTLAKEELHHKDLLHGQVVRLIERHRSLHGEPPVEMKAVYDFTHKKAIERAHEVQMLLSEFH